MKQSRFERAICFAVNAHAGMTRKGSRTPYIVHPMEARRRSAAAGWSISAKTRVQRYIKIRTDAPSSARIRFAFFIRIILYI